MAVNAYSNHSKKPQICPLKIEAHLSRLSNICKKTKATVVAMYAATSFWVVLCTFKVLSISVRMTHTVPPHYHTRVTLFRVVRTGLRVPNEFFNRGSLRWTTGYYSCPQVHKNNTHRIHHTIVLTMSISVLVLFLRFLNQ